MQAAATSSASEVSLLRKRSKAIWEIFKGLSLVFVSGILVVVLAICYRLLVDFTARSLVPIHLCAGS